MNSKSKIHCLAFAIGICSSLPIPSSVQAQASVGISQGEQSISKESSLATSVEKHLYTVKVEIQTDVHSSDENNDKAVIAKVIDDNITVESKLNSNCQLQGHLENVIAPRSGWKAIREHDRRLKKDGSFILIFDTLVLGDGQLVPVKARVLPQKSLQRIEADATHEQNWRDLKVAKDGTILRAANSLSPRKRRVVRAANLLTSVATIPMGMTAGMVVTAVTSGAIGAATSKVSNGDELQTSRTKGFVNGAVGTLMPVKLYRAVGCPGKDTALRRGDRLNVELAF